MIVAELFLRIIHGVYRRMISGEFQSFGATAVQQLECPVSRFRDSMQVQQAKPAVKRDRWEIVLGENVSESPKAIALDQRTRFHNNFGDEGGRERPIVQRIARIR